MHNTKIKPVLLGRLDNLPPVQSQVVRVFTSSTFTDTYTERNLLMKDVYPELKEYCRTKYDLDFQVVDMRWGVRDEASDDHATSGLCLQEIENCQKLSAGPNFVTFLGQRHGYRPIPAIIKASEFNHITTALLELGVSSDILTQWYWLDENAVPSEYTLQRISSVIPDYSIEDEAKRKTAKEEWMKIFSQIQCLLRQGASKCLEKGLFDAKLKHKYFMSVTESEIQSGLFDVKGFAADDHCLCFIRIISDIEENLSHPKAWRFIDMDDEKKINTEAQEFMKKLRDEDIPKSLQNNNIHRSTVEWDNETGISIDEHAEYLKQFCDMFYKATVEKIDKAVLHNKSLGENELFVEVLQHLKLAKDRCSMFHGREDILGCIQDIIGNKSRQPVVVHGQSGCGKTSIMAMCVNNIPSWIANGKNVVVVCRFLGTTPESSGISQLLISICKQIAYNYDQEFEAGDTVNDLINQLSNLMKCATDKKPLVLILDSLDQLSSANYAHKLTWLTPDLPHNVYMIVSTLPSLYNILLTLKRRIRDKNFVRIQSLGDKLGLEILTTWLDKNDRKLSVGQFDLVKEAFEKCSLPLFVRLLYEEVSLWKSYNPVSELRLSFAIRTVINDLFTRLETKHGTLFVQHSLAYITASKGGLSEMELEDILSLDDEVLADVFQYHVPPIRRIPQLVVVRLQHDIRQYFVTREADGVMVTYWYHRQFIEAAHDRYIGKNKVSKIKATVVIPDKAKAIHQALAEYFMGKWHGVEKPFKYTEAQMKKLGFKSPDSKADRKVMDQPLCYVDEYEESLMSERYNKRKISNLPYHVAKAGMQNYLLEHCLLNYDWLRAKTRAFSLREALADYQYVSKSNICSRIVQSLNLARSTLSKYPKSLGSELLARLLYIVNQNKSSHENILFRKMLQRAIKSGSSENQLVPKGQIFAEIDERIKYTLEHPSLPTNWKVVCLSPDSFSLYAVIHPNSMAVWDLHTGEIEKQFQLWPSPEPKLNIKKLTRVEPDGTLKYLLLATCYQSDANPVIVVDLELGEIIHAVKLKKNYPKLGFPENIQIDLLGNQNLLIMNIVGDECCIHNLETSAIVHRFECISRMMHVVHGKQHVVFCLKQEQCFEVYSLANYNRITSITIQETPMKMLSTIDGTFVAPKTGSMVTMWDFEAQDVTQITTFKFDKYLGTSNIMDVILSHDDQLLLIVYNGGIVVWNIKMNKLIHNCKIPDSVIPDMYKVVHYEVAISCDNEKVVATYEDYVLLWNIKSNKVFILQVANATNRALDVITSTNIENPIAVVALSRALLFQVLDIPAFESSNKDRWMPHLKMTSGVRYLDTALTCNTVVTRNSSKDVCVLNAKTGEILVSNLQELDVLKPHISPDGRFMALLRNPSSFQQVSLFVYQTDNNKLVAELPVDSTRMRTYCFSEDCNYMVTHSEDDPFTKVELAIWKMEKGCPKVKVLKADVGGISFLEFVYGDTYIAALQQYPQIGEGRDCKLRIFDVATGEEVHKSGNLLRDSLHVVFGKPFLYIIKAGATEDENVFCVFDLDKMKVTKQFDIKTVGRLAISLDGTHGVDTALQVFNLKEGELIHCFGDVNKPMIRQNQETYPRISSDGTYVVWLNLAEASVSLGNVNSKRVVGKVFTHSMPLSVRLTCDNILVVGTNEGYIMLYNLVDQSQNINTICENILNQKSMDLKKVKAKTSTGSDNSDQRNSSMCTIL